MELLPLIIFLSISAVLIFFSVLFSMKRKKGHLLGSLGMSLFLVKMLRYESKREEEKPKDGKSQIGTMEQVFSNFLSFKKPGFFQRFFQGVPGIAFEIASQVGGSDITFYVAVPKFLESNLEKYIQGVYPGAVIEKVPEDYTIFEPGGVVAGSFLRLERPYILPINTYKNLDSDPLNNVTNALSKIAPEEGAAIQIILRSVSQSKWGKRGNKILAKLRGGKSIETAIAEGSRSTFSEILFETINAFFGRGAKKKEELLTEKPKTDEIAINAIESKIQKPVFEANIRLITSAANMERAEEILSHLEGVFGQFTSLSNGFKSKRTKKGGLKKLIYNFSFRNFDNRQKTILNLEELSSLYHFPLPQMETPHIKWEKSAFSAPPSELPEEGLNLIGKVIFRGEEKKVYFASKDDRRRHFYIIGQTGTGKTSLLKEMIRQDIQNGEGVAVIDPHGELAESALAQIPKERVEDVVLFEPFDMERPVGLNMLEYETPEQKDFAVQEMIAIFHKLFPPEIIGPMFEHYMRNAMLAMMADKENPGTLVEIPRLFTDLEFMEDRLRKVADPMVRNFWLKEWRQTTGETRSDMLGYVVSKVGRFIENDMMRNIIGQSHSGFDLGKIMDEGKIFIANLSKGLTGEVNSSLLGLILVSKMQMAAMRRARVSEEERKDFYLYIDEFQNFTTDSIATILSEARKYRLNLILAHQYIPQLTDEIRNAVLGNVGTTGAFRIGANDAEFLEKQFEPEFSRFDLVNLDNFVLIVKIMINNKVSPPFKMQTILPKKGNQKIIEPIKKISKLKYGRPREAVEAEISQRSRLTNF